MAKRIGYRVERRCSAAPHVVYDVLWDVPGWARWAPLVGRGRWEEPGEPGVGSIRAIGSDTVTTREQITVHEPPHRHGYTLLSQRPCRDYQALVEIAAEGTGSVVVWTGEWTPDPGFTGPILRALMRTYIERLLAGLVKAAEKRAAAP